MSFERAQRIADTVLLEGYLLYPYRDSSMKNQYRWTFGVLAPRRYAEVEARGERWWIQAQILVEGAGTRVGGRLRFLEVVQRRIERRTGSGYEPVDRLVVDGVEHTAWDEGRLSEVPFDFVVDAGGVSVFFDHHERVDIDPLCDELDQSVGRIVRTRRALRGAVRATVEPIEGRRPLYRVTIRVENQSLCPDAIAGRAAAMPYAFASAHLLLDAKPGQLLSLTDPPPYAQRAAAECRNYGLYPALVSELGAYDQMLCAPIVLPDHPALAPESTGDFFDAGEIDELLVLRTSLLTDAEKAQARATDARVAALLDRVERMTPLERERLHGAIREKTPARLAPGAKVRLRPVGRTDAQDVLYRGLVATVHAVLQDVDGTSRLAVTIDDDPGADVQEWYGRFHYYRPDEVEALE